jgi:hypothetical protein
LTLSGCPTDSDGGSNSRGTFRVRITGIPSNVITSSQQGRIIIGIGPANETQFDGSNGLAGWSTSIRSSDDESGTDWYEFDLYNLDDNPQKFIGESGNYDIGIINNSNNSKMIIRNIRFEVNTVNVIPYSSFIDVEEEAAGKFTFIGTWRAGWDGWDPNNPQDTEYDWEYVFIDSTNFTLISPYFGWEKPGTGTYEILNEEVTYTYSDGYGYIKQGNISFVLDWEDGGVPRHNEWSYDFVLTESWFQSTGFSGEPPVSGWFERYN